VDGVVTHHGKYAFLDSKLSIEKIEIFFLLFSDW
jgi:hypothetical protein